MRKIVTNIKERMYWKESEIAEEWYDYSWEWNIVRVYPNIKKQKWYGIGGALTEASCYNIFKLEVDKQKDLIQAYYGKNALDYNLGRVSIGSNDFCLDTYELTKKKDLSDFSIERDEKYIIPIIKEIQKEKNLTLVASPWSPPAFMKDNGNLLEGGKLKKEYYTSFAKYLKKFIEEYYKKGIPITYLTIQNEPNAKQRWESCVYSLKEQKELINKYILPEMKDVDTKILLWDHNKENLFDVVTHLFIKSKKIAGIAFHSYQGQHSTNLDLVHTYYPNLLLFHTESCCGYSKYNEIEWVHDAEIYLINIINDINHGLNGYIDWNIFLDFYGGPNHKENYCKSPIILNEEGNDYILSPIYYYLGHISKYIKPGDFIIPIDVYRLDLLGVAAVNNKQVVITLLNITNDEIEVDVVVEQKRIHDYIAAHSIITYLIDI